MLDNTGTMTLTTINEDDTNPTGDTIASIIASAGGDRIADVDQGAVEGIAVVQTESAFGSWQFRTGAAGPWTNVGSVSLTNALLLAADSELRFVPNADYTGSANIQFYAWDQTTPEGAGDYVDPIATGGTGAFSTDLEFATVTVTPVNDAPVLTSGSVNNLTVAEDSGFTSLGLAGLGHSPGGGTTKHLSH